MMNTRWILHTLLVFQTLHAFPITTNPKVYDRKYHQSRVLYAPHVKNRKSNTFCALSTQGNNNDNEKHTLAFAGSLELLAIAVSIFFVATVTLGGDKLFAAPQPVPRVIIDADAVLREDFERVSNSVEF